jgi:hypothetical protein
MSIIFGFFHPTPGFVAPGAETVTTNHGID